MDEDLVEEREELMVSLSEHNSLPIIKKSHFLKPFLTTSIDESQAMLRPASSPGIKPSSFCVIFRGWRSPNKNFKLWAEKMAALHKPTWIKAGIFEAIKSSTYRIHKNPSLILSLAQKWCPQTKSFVFPWGEATITLEDVNVLLGFSVLGSSVSAPLESSEMKVAVEKLEKQRQESVKQVSWISSFVDDQIEHEAFLALWLSNFVFPDQPNFSISRSAFPIAVRLARGERIALAPAVLASLYRDLGQIRDLASSQNVYLRSLFKLIQVWIWERFKNLRPEAKVITRGQPRIAQWGGLQQTIENVGVMLLDDFEWRPYTKLLNNWNPPRFYAEEAKWITIDESLYDDDFEFVSFARFVRVSKLVGIGFVEDYYPNRVAMQFGFAQDVPCLATTHQSSNFAEKEAWDDYNRSLNGLKLYIPSRLATASFTARYRDWWMKSVSEIQKETFNPSTTVDHYDDGDDDVSLKVLPLSQVLEKLGGDGMKKKAEDLTYKRCKRAREDHDKSAMECFQTQDDEDDDINSIAQIMKSRKKCSDDVEKTEGERSRLEADYKNVSNLPQDLASGEETVARKSVFLSPLDDNKNSSDHLVAVNGVAEKKEEEDDERLKQRKLVIEVIALKLEARILKVENTLAKIKQWKIRRNHTKAQVLA